ncbi:MULTISPECIES: GntR family transcriptional regulator [unclassified Xanthobacter]|uniref:GntR family transcriptional regulator n=1 Tax=unclassified Xanthobacter TaxID=2623496 RepID=UPI001EDD30A4|nr:MULTISPECIES: GntR family transcriptional regulator [unclassified Xanthobacter]
MMLERKEPAYLQVRRYLLAEIEAGAYGPGDRLPSETELARRFNVTRNTVVHGLSSLVAAGRITRIAGKGTFVARREVRVTQHTSLVRSFDEEVVARGSQIEFRLLSFARVAPSPETAHQLRLALGEEVFRLERVRILDAVPTVQEIRFLPLALGQRLSIDALSRLPMFTILAELGRPVAHIEGVIRADAASAETASRLAITADTPVLVRDYVLSDADRVPLASGTAIFTREVQIAYAVDSPAG